MVAYHPMVSYPPTRRDDQVDEYHGEQIADPYRWLEDDHAPETKAWVDSQNTITHRWLEAVPERQELRAALRAWWRSPRRGAPWRRGDSWFQLRNTGLQDQDVLWTAVADAVDARMPGDAAWRVLLDPNELSPDGTVALSGLAASHDGTRLAYALSEAGSDWMTWRVRDVPTSADNADVVRWSKFSPAAWTPDGAGFFYAAYEAPADDETLSQVNRNQRLWYHRVGTDQNADLLVYERPDQPEWGFSPAVSHQGHWLVVAVWHGTEPRNRVYVADLRDGVPTTLQPLLDAFDAAYDFIGVVDQRALFRTDLDAPRGRVIAVALPQDPDSSGVRYDAPSPVFQEVIAEQGATLESVHLVASSGGPASGVLGVLLEQASSRLRRWTVSGASRGDLDLPGIGSVNGVASHPDQTSAYVEYSSFTTPSHVLRFDLVAGRDPVAGRDQMEGRHLVFAPALPDDAADVDLVTDQVWCTSADGTRIPMFVVHRADVVPGSKSETEGGGPGHPTLMWGYGGFNIPITPMFRAPWAVWVARGGVLAVPNLRGGGEFGRSWHDAGRLANKQNVFDDAIAAATWLIDEGWTSPAQLAISGGSNGGLLAAACLTQRPELFGAAVVEVGVLDMLRFHRFTIGWAWQSDYGNPDDPEDFAVLRAYSPLHNLRSGTSYPATLITTGDHDDRVVPGHSFKFAAALQSVQAGPAPVLIRVETDAGHGAGKPVSKIIDERADVLAFLIGVLGDPSS